MTDTDTAKAEGRAAYAAGVPLDDNPYGYLSDMRALMWEQGWLEAELRAHQRRSRDPFQYLWENTNAR